MAARAVEVLTVYAHMNVEFLVGFCEGGIEVSVFNAVSAATEEMTDAAIFSRRPGHALGNLVPVGREVFLLVSRKNFRFFYRMTRPGGKFLIGAGLLMADEAVYL